MVIKVFPKIFESKKERLKILILGAYVPSQFGEKLNRLKACLLKHGFKNTKLVADFPDEPKFHPTSWEVHFQRKSFYYIMNWAQVLLFVYFEGADNQGVTRELSYMIDNAIEKTSLSVILHSESLRLSTMIKADIEEHRIFEYTFKDDQELCEMAVGFCRDMVYHLFDTI